MKKEFRTKNLLSPLALSPRFIEVFGCIVLEGGTSELLPQKEPESPEDRQKVEYVLNRREVWELFEVPPPEPSPRLLCEAGNTIRDAWEARLISEFPGRRFVVYFEYAPPVCDVGFFQALDWHIEAADQAKTSRGTHRVDWRPKLTSGPLMKTTKGRQ